MFVCTYIIHIHKYYGKRYKHNDLTEGSLAYVAMFCVYIFKFQTSPAIEHVFRAVFRFHPHRLVRKPLKGNKRDIESIQPRVVLSFLQIQIR